MKKACAYSMHINYSRIIRNVLFKNLLKLLISCSNDLFHVLLTRLKKYCTHLKND